ncbi:MAG: hypothetical protein MJY64_02535 [archaeon]|nr:hypothetical protein [archaeon]
MERKDRNKDQFIGNMSEAKEPTLKIDPNTGLIERVFEDDSINIDKQLWGKNSNRSQALEDLWYEDLQKNLEKSNKNNIVKNRLAFLMTVNNVIDLIMDSVPEELAVEMSYFIDNAIAMALVNKNYDVNILEEEEKAISVVKREDYDTDDDYERALEAIEDHWWSIGQPALEMRSANDAIIEMLRKYKLNE